MTAFGEFKTPYGMKAYSSFTGSASAQFGGMPAQQLVALHDRYLQDLVNGDIGEDYGLSVDGITMDQQKLHALFNENRETLRLHIIRACEDYFVAHGTDADAFFSAAKQGHEQARKVMAYAGVFPIEALNVRTELNDAAYMRRVAQSDGEYNLFRFIPVDEETVGAALFKEGPVLPLPADFDTERMIRHHWRMVEWHLKNADEDPSSTPQAVH